MFNLRYPGQYADEESGLFYHYFRSYDARTGRYSQPDPIGLNGGWNRFGYVDANPLQFTDPFGLEKLNLLNGRSVWSSNSQAMLQASRFPDRPGELLIFGHADSKSIADDRDGGPLSDNRKSLDAEALARLIRESGKWKDGMPITIYGCNAATGPDSLAERLSKILNTRVGGFGDTLILHGSGKTNPVKPTVFTP